jgi:hypothetical protein
MLNGSQYENIGNEEFVRRGVPRGSIASSHSPGFVRNLNKGGRFLGAHQSGDSVMLGLPVTRTGAGS